MVHQPFNGLLHHSLRFGVQWGGFIQSAAVDRQIVGFLRGRAEWWFSHTRMGEEYVRMYQYYLASGPLPDGHVTA